MSPMARRAARLAAVQALYQMELTSADAEIVAEQFVAHRFGQEMEASPAGEPDAEFFADLLRGVPKHQVEIDRSVARCLSADWKLERIDSILRAILRAATYEMIGRKDVPAKVVIDEYVDIAHAFFGADEPAFVNAVLHRLAHRKRAPEFGETPPDDELQF
jgi:N utilization substance protein B